MGETLPSGGPEETAITIGPVIRWLSGPMRRGPDNYPEPPRLQQIMDLAPESHYLLSQAPDILVHADMYRGDFIDASNKAGGSMSVLSQIHISLIRTAMDNICSEVYTTAAKGSRLDMIARLQRRGNHFLDAGVSATGLPAPERYRRIFDEAYAMAHVLFEREFGPKQPPEPEPSLENMDTMLIALWQADPDIRDSTLTMPAVQ